MTIKDDLLKIKELQDQFKNTYGVYFEMDWAHHKIDIPKEDDKLNLKKVKRFIGNDPLGKIFPNKDITEIDFEPTMKDWRFTIGRGIKKDLHGNLLTECWYCQAAQKTKDGLITIKIINGGDPYLLQSDGLTE